MNRRSGDRRWTTWVGCALLAAIALPVGAAAQETRAGQLENERRAKAKQLQPYRPGKIEAALYRIEDRFLIERVFNPPRGLFLRWGGFPEGGGIAVGPGLRYSNHAVNFTTTGAMSLRQYWDVDSRLSFTNLLGARALASVGVRHRDYPQEDFFGLGPNTPASLRTNYALRQTAFDVTGAVTPADWLGLGASVEHLSPEIEPGEDPRLPSTDALFSDASAPGLAAQPTFVRLGARATVDFTDRPIGPRAGGRYSVGYDRYVDRDLARYTFGRWDVDLRQYVPLVGTVRSLAFRAYAAGSTPDAGHEVPFYLQPTVGGGYSLRGLRPYRFRDRHVMFFQAEYRWDVNPFITGVVFYDAGKVARDWRDLNFDDLEDDYGVGLRLGFLGAVAMRAELALGGADGTRFVLKFNDAF
jgi:hypothetical protein